jgi:molybdopterin synthase catalytic subunit
MQPQVRIQTEDFDSGAEIARLHRDALGVGAVASFIGVCRNRNEGDAVTQMELEHYPGMTEQSIERMIDEARKRFNIVNASVIHRVGIIKPGEQIVLVAVSSSHRGVAFQACEFLMDYLKTQAPFWKKETLPNGTARWVDARVSDDQALKKWGLNSSNA